MVALNVDGMTIEYETRGEGPPLVMVMGLNNQLIHWPEPLLDLIAAEGLQVIVFDNRDAGLTTKFHELGVPPVRSMVFKRLMGFSVTSPYTLSDMAGDVVRLLDGLELKSAHVLGVSLGGMIAQTVAIEHSERVRSLTSMMSTNGDRYVSQFKALWALLKRPGPGKESFANGFVEVFRVIGSPGFPFPEDFLRDLGRRAYERCYCPQGFYRQLAAVLGSPSRSADLKKLTVPSLVIHGQEDPLVPVAAGKATARDIPGAKLEIFEGMGHSLPQELWPDYVRLIKEHVFAHNEVTKVG